MASSGPSALFQRNGSTYHPRGQQLECAMGLYFAGVLGIRAAAVFHIARAGTVELTIP